MQGLAGLVGATGPATREGELPNRAIAEHVENAGVHRGDATLLLSARTLVVEAHRCVKTLDRKTSWAVRISGPCNAQFICQGNKVRVIECNLRTSRSMPLISAPTTGLHRGRAPELRHCGARGERRRA